MVTHQHIALTAQHEALVAARNLGLERKDCSAVVSIVDTLEAVPLWIADPDRERTEDVVRAFEAVAERYEECALAAKTAQALRSRTEAVASPGDPEFDRETHARWMTKLNRRMEDPGYREEWRVQQCGSCSFFISLSGSHADDYGACANARSRFDHQVMFEHDGCDEHVNSGRWD